MDECKPLAGGNRGDRGRERGGRSGYAGRGYGGRFGGDSSGGSGDTREGSGLSGRGRSDTREDDRGIPIPESGFGGRGGDTREDDRSSPVRGFRRRDDTRADDRRSPGRGFGGGSVGGDREDARGTPRNYEVGRCRLTLSNPC